MWYPEKRFVVGAALMAAAAITAAACGGGDSKSDSPSGSSANDTAKSAPVNPNATKIKVTDNAFSPDSVTIKAGGSVVWDWAGTSNFHSILVDSQTSGQKSGSGTFEKLFEKPGTIDYQCSIHGSAMKGKIIVE